MIWLITWTRNGITRVTRCISGESIAFRYALMREHQGFTVDITEEG